MIRVPVSAILSLFLSEDVGCEGWRWGGGGGSGVGSWGYAFPSGPLLQKEYS